MAFLVREALPKPPIKIKEYSIEPSSIKAGKSATITMTIKNVDLKTHEISLYFKVSPRVIIYTGAEQPLPYSDSRYVYTFSMSAEDPTEDRAFTLTATLESGSSRADYPIVLEVKVDGRIIQKNWKDITITVKS